MRLIRQTNGENPAILHEQPSTRCKLVHRYFLIKTENLFFFLIFFSNSKMKFRRSLSTILHGLSTPSTECEQKRLNKNRLCSMEMTTTIEIPTFFVHSLERAHKRIHSYASDTIPHGVYVLCVPHSWHDGCNGCHWRNSQNHRAFVLVRCVRFHGTFITKSKIERDK